MIPRWRARCWAEAAPDGLTLRLALPPPSYARRGGEIIAAQLREVGIETEITNMEWADWLERVFRGHDFDLTIISHTEPMDINIYARPDYYFRYARPEFVALNDELSTTSDPGERFAPDGRNAADDRHRLRQRLPVPARQDGRGECRDRGAVGKLAHAGQRPDSGALDPVTPVRSDARRQPSGWWRALAG